MRSAKVPTNQASTAAVAESDALEQSKIQRLRKASRSTSQCLSSVSTSANSSDAEGPTSPGRGPRLEAVQARHAVVIDHQGAGKVVHKPDGTVVWEPAPECADGAGGHRGGSGGRGGNLRDEMLKVLGTTFLALSCGSGVVGFMATHVAAEAAGAPCCLTTKELAEGISRYVAGSVAGLATGMVLGPLLAVRNVAGALVRPAVVGLLLHQGVSRIARWRSGVAGLLRKLQSGDPSRVMEALRAIIAAARRNPRFAREFNKLKGIELLLQRLAAAMPDCPMLHLIAQALAELCRDSECRDSLVAAGGVPRLVALLRNHNPVVSGHALAALAALADHALAVEAIRETGGLTRLVELTAAAVPSPPPPPPASTTTAAGSSAAAASGLQGGGGPAALNVGNLTAPGAATATAATAAAATVPMPVLATASGVYDRRAALLPAVKLLQALSLDPANKAAIGAAGGIPALLDVVARSEPRSETQVAAIVALHSCLRGCPDNQRTLAALPAASEVLRGALGGFGPCWQPAKGDLHAVLNVLARLQGVQEASGFVVVQSQAAAAAGPTLAGATAARA
ncbi:hypothetical protein PLESTF_001127800 [Pleodorina starrii]|nr:hypothetical protein PLESTM_001296500 [Pleodorina starrii]GLC71493.1 hypothetical protein PLESTF_001127800 [Pleodorina starrii]